MKSFLVVSKEPEVLRVIRSCFSADYSIGSADGKESALERLKRTRYDVIFIDIEILRGSSPGGGYNENLEKFWHLFPTIQVIVMCPQERIREAVKAVKAGASDYITYPLNVEEVKHITESIYESIIAQSELDYLRDQFWQSDSLEMVQTKNPEMKKVFDKIRSVAPTKSTVLLFGETGSGKGVLAKLIHRHSTRGDAQFIDVHCGAIPDTLLESELFGHEKGAFTGAVRRKLGKFEIAQGGTIFLDEIGTITPSAQIKLLQVLQDGNYQRVGGEGTLEANVRIIAATNMDLKKMCDDGQFRRDLYYRLNVFPIEILPLRERVEDIPLLADVFLKKFNNLFQREMQGIHPEVMKAFKSYFWPGNIREMENLMERAYILETTPILNLENFPNELFESKTTVEAFLEDSCPSLAEVRAKGIESIERQYLKELLTLTNGKIRIAADIAKISTRQLHKLMTKYGIRKEEFRAST
jgi:DNA-binding NtrC family response regulator